MSSEEFGIDLKHLGSRVICIFDYPLFSVGYVCVFSFQ